VAVSAGGDAYLYHGTTWSAGTIVDQGHALNGVSCASPAFCAAVGAGGHAAVLTGGTGLTGGSGLTGETGTAGAPWTATVMGSTARAIACPAAGYCVAVDGSGGALTYADGTWSAVTRINGTVAADALSCPAVGRCVAADHDGNVLSYAPPARG
jgi:hypothetical protein